MQKIGGQGVEQVGKDKLPAVKPFLLVGFGQHGVGGYARKKSHGKGCSGNVLEPCTPDQWCGQHGHKPGPVHGLYEIAYENARGNKHAEL